MVYTTQGTCSRQITFDVIDNKLTNVRFLGGCSGNTQGVSKLVEGMDIDEVIKRTESQLCTSVSVAFVATTILRSSAVSGVPISSLISVCGIS